VSLVVYWVGDSLDGIVARIRDCETRTGAALDILSDRFCAAAFYVGLAWTLPHLSPAIFVYLAEFMVIDCFISLSALAWPITSPNYFHVIDRRIWLFNWSRAGKTVNSGLFAVMLLLTRDYAWGMWLGLVIASGLFAMKSVSLVWMMRLGIPVPAAGLSSDTPPGRHGSPVKLVLTTLLVGFGSAVLPFINIEAYLGALGAAVTSTTPMVVAIAAAAAVGQTIGKVVLYYAAEWAMNLSWIKRKTSVAEVPGDLPALADPDPRAPGPDRRRAVRVGVARLPAAAGRRHPGRPDAREHRALRQHLRDRPLRPVPRDPRCRRLAGALMDVRTIAPADTADLRRRCCAAAATSRCRRRGAGPPRRRVRRAAPGRDRQRAARAGSVGTGEPGWRFRGMATDPTGAARVRVCWCSTRWWRTSPSTAAGALVQRPHPGAHFYERAGLVVRGEEWVDPEIGPHVVMWRRVPAPDEAVRAVPDQVLRVAAMEPAELPAEHLADPRQNSSGSSAASGFSATIRSTMPRSRRSVDRTCWARASSGACSTSRCMIALAPSGGSGESHACCAAITRSAGKQRERATAVALAEHQAQRRRPQGHQVGEAARDLAGEAALLRLGRQRRSGVSITVISGSPSSTASRIPRRASRSAPGPSGCALVWPRRSWPRKTHGASPKRANAISSPGSLSP
jgi:CDP-diacylglycerol--glycerol-3-phosphate 3-phosphatidyltransferase